PFLVLFAVYLISFTSYLFFFFQAEDGIRDRNVTGVQACALPICVDEIILPEGIDATVWIKSGLVVKRNFALTTEDSYGDEVSFSSEERRVGKECESRGGGHAWKEEQNDVKRRTQRGARAEERRGE